MIDFPTAPDPLMVCPFHLIIVPAAVARVILQINECHSSGSHIAR